jgi:hypothetical protein
MSNIQPKQRANRNGLKSNGYHTASTKPLQS